MEKINLTPTQHVSEEKKNNAFKKLVDKGKAVGHLTAQEIDNLIVELDLDVDELEKLNDMIDGSNISIVDEHDTGHQQDWIYFYITCMPSSHC